MSLLVDPDYIIYSLRLAYLRRIDDHHGARVITLPSITTSSDSSTIAATTSAELLGSQFSSDSHVVVGGLNNPQLHPEITSIHSPTAQDPTFDSSDLSHLTSTVGTPGHQRRSSKVGTGLKYTQTIYGPGRTGAVGMRVSGKRAPSMDQLSSIGETSGSNQKGFTRRSSMLRTQSGDETGLNQDKSPFSGATSHKMSHSSSEGLVPTASTIKNQSGIPQFEFHAATENSRDNPLSHARSFGSNAFSSSQSTFKPQISSFSSRKGKLPLRASGSDEQMRSSSPFDSSSNPSPPLETSTNRGVFKPTHKDIAAVVVGGKSALAQVRSGGGSRPRSASDGSNDVLPRGSLTSSSPRLGQSSLARSSSLATHREGTISNDSQPFSNSRIGSLRTSLDGQGQDNSLDSSIEGSEDGTSYDGAGTDGRDDLESDFDDTQSTWPTRASGPSATDRPGMISFSARSASRERRPSKLTVDGTPMNSQHFFTPVTEVDESHFGFGPIAPTARSSPTSSRAELSPQAPALSPLPSLEAESLVATSATPLSAASSASVLAGSLAGPASLFANSLQPSQSPTITTPSLEQANSNQNGSRTELSGDSSLNPGDQSSALGLETGSGMEVSSQDEGSRPAGTTRSRKGLDPSSDDKRRRPSRSARSRSRAPTAPTPNPSLQEPSFAPSKTDASTVASRHASQPKVSALSALLRKQNSGPSNSFAQFYAGVAGRSSDAPSAIVEIYFPFAEANNKQPAPGQNPNSSALTLNAKTKSMKLCVRKDAPMEELIGYSLYCYVEEGWKPELDKDTTDEEALDIKLTTIGYTLRIVEDGEVDDDFPAIDRSLKIGKFGGDEFAICAATAAQIKQHLSTQPANKKRQTSAAPASSSTTTSAVPANRPSAMELTAPLPPGPVSRLTGGANATAGSLISVQGTPIFASSALGRSVMGPSSASIFLRVLITPNSEVKYRTTLQVPSEMYLADVLEMICKKRHLENADEWALTAPDKMKDRDIVVPLDRTVESLQGNHDLQLVRRSTLGAQGGAGALKGQSTNPNASIFKRYSEPPAPRYNKALDVSSAYKTYTVNRKMPFVGRHERVLTLDGDWVHIMPSDSRAFQTRAASFHISSIVSCKQNKKAESTFKLVVWRETPRDTKRYDFEADNPRLAANIVSDILSRSQRGSTSDKRL